MIYKQLGFTALFLLLALAGFAQESKDINFKGVYRYQNGLAAKKIKKGDQEIHLPAVVWQSSSLEIKSWGRAKLKQRFRMAGEEFSHKMRWESHADTLFLYNPKANIPSDTLLYNEHGNLQDLRGQLRFFKEDD